MVLSWSRACYVELVRRAGTAAFIQCHVNAFEYLGGVPRRCLYGNAKVVTLGRDEDGQVEWNLRMLDFARRMGFEMRPCRPYRAQTKGKVESGVKYVRSNPCSSQGQAMWPSIRFTDDAGLNRQGLEWCDSVVNARVHGTTHRIPWEMLDEERSHLGKLPGRAPWRRISGGTGRWPETASSAGRVPATASTGSGLAPSCRWASGWAQWKSGPAASGSRCIPGPSGPVSASSCPVSASSCPVSGLICLRRTAVRTGSGGGAGPRRRVATPLPGRVRTGGGRCQVIALEQARQHLETLGLKQAVEVLDNTPDTAASKQLPYPEMLAELLGAEVAARRERYLTTRTRLAHLPSQRTLEQFDFGFQPSVDERLVKELANLACVAEATNILLLGPPGVGKTHLAIAQGFGAYFVRAYDLMEDLRKARIEHNLDRRMKVYLPPGCSSWTSSASGPMTGSQPPPSSPWSLPGTSVGASS